jgi:hypothetical protein
LARRILIAVYIPEYGHDWPAILGIRGQFLQYPSFDARLSYDFDIILTLQMQQRVVVWRTHPIKKETPTKQDPSFFACQCSPTASRSNGSPEEVILVSRILCASAAAPDAAVPFDDQQLIQITF